MYGVIHIVVLAQRWGSMILVVFSHLNDFIILWCFISTMFHTDLVKIKGSE